jgi:hypothetical protein
MPLLDKELRMSPFLGRIAERRNTFGNREMRMSPFLPEQIRSEDAKSALEGPLRCHQSHLLMPRHRRIQGHWKRTGGILFWDERPFVMT